MGGIGLLALLTLLFGVRPLAQRPARRDTPAIDAIEAKGLDDAPENELVTTENGLTGLRDRHSIRIPTCRHSVLALKPRWNTCKCWRKTKPNVWLKY